MFKPKGLTYQVNAVRFITRIMRYGLVTFTVQRKNKKQKPPRLCNSGWHIKWDHTFDCKKFHVGATSTTVQGKRPSR